MDTKIVDFESYGAAGGARKPDLGCLSQLLELILETF
jgi:hypothetical protein